MIDGSIIRTIIHAVCVTVATMPAGIQMALADAESDRTGRHLAKRISGALR